MIFLSHIINTETHRALQGQCTLKKEWQEKGQSIKAFTACVSTSICGVFFQVCNQPDCHTFQAVFKVQGQARTKPAYAFPTGPTLVCILRVVPLHVKPPPRTRGAKATILSEKHKLGKSTKLHLILTLELTELRFCTLTFSILYYEE